MCWIPEQVAHDWYNVDEQLETINIENYIE